MKIKQIIHTLKNKKAFAYLFFIALLCVAFYKNIEIVNSINSSSQDIITLDNQNVTTPVNNNIIEVTLNKTIDGDTAKFNINGEVKTVRFLFIDTPEYTKTKEPFGKEATEFTSNLLNNATKIELEYDGAKTDKYNRELAWVFVTDKNNNRLLLQEELAKNGLVEKYYDYGNYKYENTIRKSLNDKNNIFQKKG